MNGRNCVMKGRSQDTVGSSPTKKGKPEEAETH
jgi:hypothetical protein